MTVELAAGGVPGALAALPGARRLAGPARADDTTEASDAQERSFRRALAEAQPEPAGDAEDAPAGGGTGLGAADTALALAQAGLLSAPMLAPPPSAVLPTTSAVTGAVSAHAMASLGDGAVAPGALPASPDAAGGPRDRPASSGAASIVATVPDLIATATAATNAHAHATATATAAATASSAAVAADATDAVSIAGFRAETGPWTPPGAGSPLATTPVPVAARAVRIDATGSPPAGFTLASATVAGPTPATLLLQRGAMGDGKALATGAASSAAILPSGPPAIATGTAARSGTETSDAIGPGIALAGTAAPAASDPSITGLGAGAMPLQPPSRRGLRSGAGGEAEGTATSALSGGAASGPSFAAPTGTGHTAPLGTMEPAATALLDAFGWWMSQKTQAAELTLDVGGQPVSVSVKVQGNEAQVVFRSDAPEARQALAQALPQLREMLGGEGLMLSGASVADHGGGAAGREREAASAPANPSIGARSGEPRAGADGASAMPRPRATAGSRALDLYV